MSFHWFIAFRAVTAITGTHQCELLFLNEKITAIRAVAMSTNGEVRLSQFGSGNGLSAIVQRGDEPLSVVPIGRLFRAPVLKGVDDQKTVVGDFQNRFQNTSLQSSFVMKGDQYDLVAPPSPTSLVLTSEVNGVDGSGEIFGALVGKTDPLRPQERYTAAFVWAKGGYAELDQDDFPFATVAVARTTQGVFGFLTRDITGNRRMKVRSGMVPVLFRREGIVTLPLPTGVRFAISKAASPDGSLMVANSIISPDNCPIVWDQGVPFVPAFGKQRWPTGSLVAVAATGSTAVGTMGAAGSRTVAVAWERDHGMRTLADIAAERELILPFGWRLAEAVGVSPDGNVVFGTAVNWKGIVRPFRLWLEKRTAAK